MKRGMFFALIGLFSSSLYPQYIGGLYTDIFTLKVGGVMDNVSLQREIVQNGNTTTYEAFGNGWGLAALFTYEHRLNGIWLTYGIGFLSHQPAITTKIGGNTVSEKDVIINNYLTIDLMLKFAFATGFYFGLGPALYIPVASELEKPKGEGFAQIEIGWNMQTSPILYFTPAIRLGYNFTGNNWKIEKEDKLTEFNVQLYVGIGFRAFQEAGY